MQFVSTKLMREKTLASLVANIGANTKLTALATVTPFVPGPDFSPVGLVAPTFAGYAVIDIVVVDKAKLTFDPAASVWKVEILGAPTGLSWVASGPVAPTQTVVGYWFIGLEDQLVYGSAQLSPPAVFAAQYDGRILPRILYTVAPNFLA
jgi:hypothetical protein